MSDGRWLDPNLARSPFENDRPVVRLAWALWVLALLVGGAAFWMGNGARREASSRQGEWARATAEAASARDRSVRLRAGLESEDLASRNQRTEFLNLRIAERAFSWNRLFDHLTGLMPRGVRLQNLAPEGFLLRRGSRNAAASSPATTRVTMHLRGEAEDTESLLEFVDRLYAHPAFANPNLARESAQKDLRIRFDLTVEYLPAWRPGGTTAATAVTASGLPARSGGLLGGVVAPLADAAPRPVTSPAGPATERLVEAADPAPSAASEPAAPGEARRQSARENRFDREQVKDDEATLGASAAAPRGNELSRRGLTAGSRRGGDGKTGLDPSLVIPTPLKPYASSAGGRQ